MTIRKKLTLTYTIILLCGFALTVILTFFGTRLFLIRSTNSELKKNAKTMVQTLSSVTANELSERHEADYLVMWSFLKRVNNLADGIIIVTSPTGTVLFSNHREIPPRSNLDIERINNNRNNIVSFNGQTYLMAQERLQLAADANYYGRLYFLVDMVEIKQLSRRVFVTLLPGLFLTTLLVVIISAVFARSVAGPIKRLSNFARKTTPMHPLEPPVIKSGDEIEQLGDSIADMTRRLHEYHNAQRSFLHNVSHELKTPLMNIQGYAEGVRDGIIPMGEVNDSMDIIVSESNKMRDMVNNLILLGRMESPDATIEHVKLDLCDVVSDALNAVRGMAMKKDMAISFRSCKASVYGDAEKLERAFVNLLSNCIRHGKHRVEVVIKSDKKPVVTISDDGAGFKEDEIDRIFNRFYKGTNGESGLGLPIAKAVLHRHGATLEAHNRAEGGAQYVVRFTNALPS